MRVIHQSPCRTPFKAYNRNLRTRVNCSVEGWDANEAFRAATARAYALEEYRLLMHKPDEYIDVLQAATLIARHRHPFASHEDLILQLDDLAVGVEGLLPSSQRYPLRILKTINEYLYVNRGFKGNTDDYYNPDNSCINKVIEDRVGIPLTLSLVYSEVAKRVDMPLLGVNVPGHFFLAPQSAEAGEFLIDAFEGGRISFLEDAEETLQKIYKQKVKLDPAFLQRKTPLPARTFLTRMLNNLKQVYKLKENITSCLIISEYLRATRPGDVDEVRDQGVLLFQLKRYEEAALALREYLARVGHNSEDASKIRKLLEKIDQSRPS